MIKQRNSFADFPETERELRCRLQQLFHLIEPFVPELFVSDVDAETPEDVLRGIGQSR